MNYIDLRVKVAWNKTTLCKLETAGEDVCLKRTGKVHPDVGRICIVTAAAQTQKPQHTVELK